jgi:hypothetical protein
MRAFHPIVVFAFVALGVFGLLVALAVRQLAYPDPAAPGAWRRFVFAALMWILITLAAAIPLVIHTMLMAHGPVDTNPWLAAPLLLVALPIHAGLGIWLYRWAMRARQA